MLKETYSQQTMYEIVDEIYDVARFDYMDEYMVNIIKIL